jgi:drug/metabolite transporter (DMT)-like permease
VVVGFLGVAVFLRFWDAFGGARPGDLLSLGAAAAFGAYGVITRPLVGTYPFRELMAYTLAIGGSLLVVAGLPAAVRQDWSGVDAVSWLVLVYAAVFPVYVAYALWNWAIRRRGIPRTVVFGFLTPVIAGALAVAGLGERVGVEQVLGGMLVVGGLVLTRLDLRSRPGRAPAPAIVEEAG